MVKKLWHTKVLVNIRQHLKYILENYTFIGAQYLPYVGSPVERSIPGTANTHFRWNVYDHL